MHFPKLPAATSPVPALTQLPGFRLCARKDTHADVQEALSGLRGLGSQTPDANFPKPGCFVLGRSAARIHFLRVLTA